MDEYDKLFDSFSVNGQPIPGARLREFFLKTGLTTQQLSEIWDMSDIDRDGCLDRAEFISACGLIKAVGERLGKSIDLFYLMGSTLPTEKPERKSSSAAATMWDTFANLINPADDEERRFREMFTAVDINGTGFLTGEQAKPLLAASRLPRPVLARIWNEADPTGSGKLSLPQFITAMRACEQMKTTTKETRRPSITDSARKSLEARRQMEMRVQEEYALSQRRVINERLSDAQREQEALKASIQAAKHECASLEDKVNLCRTKLDSLNQENEVSQAKTAQLQQQCVSIDAEYEQLNQRYKELTEQCKNRMRMSKELDVAIAELEERNRHAADQQLNSDDDTALQELTSALEVLVVEESRLRQQLIDTRVELENMKTSAMTLESTVLEKWTKMDEAEEEFIQLVNKTMEENNDPSDELLAIFDMTSKLTDIDLSSKRPIKTAAATSNDPFQGHDPFVENLNSNEWMREKESSPEEKLLQRKKNAAPPLPIHAGKLYPDLPATVDYNTASLFPDISMLSNSDRKAVSSSLSTVPLPSVVRAKKDYHSAKRQNHLSFDVGDIIQVRSEQDEWYSGELNGKIGWLPKSYVESLDNATIDSRFSNGAEQAGKIRLCRALYDFESDIAGDLRLSKNDIIVIDDDTKTWWKGHVGSRSGNFPSNYVEIVELTNKMPDMSKGEYMVKALFQYSPAAEQQHNDLTFKRGDLIKILGSAGESWLYGQIADRCGMLPANYVQRI